MPELLNGKIARDFYKQKLVERIKKLGFYPTLALIQIGINNESNIYIEQKKKFAKMIGAQVMHIFFPETTKELEIENKIKELNKQKEIHGIIIQLPILPSFNKNHLINLIEPTKDVDGLTNENQTLLEKGVPYMVPATARAVLMLLDFYNISIVDKNVTVLGRSRLVGHPLTLLLKIHGAHVTVCHSKTENTKDITRKSDMVFVAIGKPEFIDSSYIKKDAVVIDIGINEKTHKLEEEIPSRKLVGDVKFDEISKIASKITPVPGGVGPMTVLSLFANLILSAENS